MIYRFLDWAWRRFRPEEGWLSFFLLCGAVATLVVAVVAVEWVPEGHIVGWTSALGLVLSLVLAKRPLGRLPAWALIIAYGLAVTTIRLGQLWPPLSLVVSGWGTSSAYIRQSWGLFVDRVGGWLEAVLRGNSSQETIVFAFGLGLAAWLLAAYAAWSTFRQRRPLAGLALMGLALGLNGYYGQGPVWPAALFIALAPLLAAAVHHVELEQSWDARQVDYSTEIRLDLLAMSAGVALVLFAASFSLPSLNLRQLSRAVLDRPAIHQAEEALSRAFAGVRQPRPEALGEEAIRAQAGLPRSFLLGNPPELYERVVMTATVRGEVRPVIHWRGLSYDVYTGRGWAISSERQETIAAQEFIPLPIVEQPVTVEQSVSWLFGEAATRYTLGLPLRFDHEVTAFWRGLEDLSRVRGQGTRYSAGSQVTAATPAELRQANLADVPPAILARYTELPDSLPERVRELARDVAGDPRIVPTPYDQARALERFLRQYPYSLEVELPAPGTDPVDFFLFELQTGYCDYYASAMVALARSLGLPARLASGFLAQPADESGVQTIHQIDAHSWAEVYFAGYGWVEFEPTAAFPASDSSSDGSLVTEEELSDLVPGFEPPPLPHAEPSRQRLSPLWGLLLLGLVLAGLWLWRRRKGQSARVDGVLWAYGRLQRSARGLGQPTPPSQTPSEFVEAFLNRLQHLAQNGLASRLGLAFLQPHIEQMTSSFISQQYGGRPGDGRTAIERWRRVRIRFWLLRLLEKVPR